MAAQAQLSEKASKQRAAHDPSSPIPPRLPPRTNTVPLPPPYSAEDTVRSNLVSEQWRSQDPRSSSTLSLIPSHSAQDRQRRTLLLVYIHGFLGDESSFQSFPAHVHNLLTITLDETHAVHTKIYPRYKSRKAIKFAREEFNTWLEPHESHSTDVILLGHSMGGILSAEAALQPSDSATGMPFQRRILGTINFDTPFLGIHPGVVASGISSLFRPAPKPPSATQPQPPPAGFDTSDGSSQASTSSQIQTSSVADYDDSVALSGSQSTTSPLSSTSSSDPFFDPPFPNDVRLQERKGWTSLVHFINKHSDNLTMATKQYFMSHLEFGGCLADYPGLMNRYERLRALENADELASRDGLGHQPPVRRIRFVNYYTASTGRPKAAKIPPGEAASNNGERISIEDEMTGMSINQSTSSAPTRSISVEEQRGSALGLPQHLDNKTNTTSIEKQTKTLGDNSDIQNDFQEPPDMRHIDANPIDDDYDSPSIALASSTAEAVLDGHPSLPPATTEPALPPLPQLPTEPESIDLSLYTDKDSRKVAEKEQKRVVKAYQQAVKDRESAIKDRKKLLEKREKKALQNREKALKVEEKERLKEEKEEEKGLATAPRERQSSTGSSESVQDYNPQKDKKFCMLPPKRGGQGDKCWVRVYMEGVDEVGAHCGLFFPGPQYESLVGDVGARIETWAQEGATRRIILESQGGE